MERLASQSSEYNKSKKNQIVQVSRRIELYIDLDLEHNQVKFYQFKHVPNDNSKSRWNEVARKEITLDEFHSDSSAREEILILSLELQILNNWHYYFTFSNFVYLYESNKITILDS